MSQVSLFEALPNEVIISIFEYLKAAENFHSFFNLNNRLRKLVKRHVWFSRSQLRNDIQQYSELHNWYKDLDFNDDGQLFYLLPFHDQPLHQRTDVSDIHWRISRDKALFSSNQRIANIISQNSIRLNPLFHPFGRAFSSGFQRFIDRHYPLQSSHLKAIVFNPTNDNSFVFHSKFNVDLCAHLDFIFDHERERLTTNIIQAACRIWKALQQIEDLNILTIASDEISSRLDLSRTSLSAWHET